MFERICIILLVNILFFAKTITYKYVSDDIPVSQRPKNWRNQWEKLWFRIEGCIRTTPQEDHFLTTIIHALVCVFIFTAFGSSDVSFLASLLFAFNPINNQASVWISGRGYALSALGMTAAMSFPVVGPLILLLATYSNAGFIAPIALLGSKFSWMCLFLPLIWGFHYYRFKKNVVDKINQEMFSEDKKINPKKLILGFKTFGFYLVHALIPIKNTFYHAYMQSMAGCNKDKAYSLKDRFFWIGVVAVLLILYRFIFSQWDIVNFGLLWWCVCISPFCNLYRMQQEIAERYAYLPNVGLMVVLAYYLSPSPILSVVFITMYATRLWFYMDAFTDDYWLVEHSCVNSPDAWFCWHVKAMKRWETKSYHEAVILWTMAKIISPREFKILFNLATALKLSRYDAESLEYLKLAEKNIPAGQEEMVGKLISDWKNGNMSVLL